METEGLLDYRGIRGSCPLYGGTFARPYSVSIDQCKCLGIGNDDNKQGRGHQPRLLTMRTQYGNSVSTPEATRTCTTQQNPLRKESPYGIQYRPHIVDTDTIADAVFGDAVSETSKIGEHIWPLLTYCQ